MNHQMAVIVQVYTFRCDIRREQDSHGAVLFAERFDNPLLFDIGQARVELHDGLIAGSELFFQVFKKESKRGDAFGKDNDAW